MGKRLTNKQKVLKKYPDAYAFKWAGPCPWVIYAGDDPFVYQYRTLSAGNTTAAAAWAVAGRGLK